MTDKRDTKAGATSSIEGYPESAKRALSSPGSKPTALSDLSYLNTGIPAKLLGIEKPAPDLSGVRDVHVTGVVFGGGPGPQEGRAWVPVDQLKPAPPAAPVEEDGEAMKTIIELLREIKRLLKEIEYFVRTRKP